jgi:hypothetical protein
VATLPVSSDVPKMQPQSTEIVHVEAHPLKLQRAPEEVLREATLAAQALADVIESNPNKVVINGKTFLTYEDWLTVARFFGITVAARSTEYIEQGRVQGYECHAEAIRTDGMVISAAQAMCMDDEQTWRDKPLYQLRSMAQTRACAKALRNVLAWVVRLKGYQPTPAEEMDGVKGQAIASRIECKPLHSDRVRKLCFELANAPTIDVLKQRYLAAGREAKSANDREALNAFIAAKDGRKRELQ